MKFVARDIFIMFSSGLLAKIFERFALNDVGTGVGVSTLLKRPVKQRGRLTTMFHKKDVIQTASTDAHLLDRTVWCVSLFLLFLCVFPVSAVADHHGRGQEQLNGFPGSYTVGTQATVTFTHDNHVIFVANAAKVVVTVMSYEINDGVMTLQDVSPPAFFPDSVQECTRTSAGEYTITDIENGFSLSRLDEPCPPRGRIIDGVTFVNYEKPSVESGE